MKSLDYFLTLKKTLDKINHNEIEKVGKIISTVIKRNGNIFTCGNGGSAHNASHIITDFNLLYKKKINSFCLADNKGIITANANDYSYDEIFSNQLLKFAKKNDLLIVLSGSGNSKNILMALKVAKNIGCKTVAFLGFDGGKAKKLAQTVLHVRSHDMQICEDIHMMFGHILTKIIANMIVVKK
jgi:D-sedoheptulose 7-phosphate isomerase